MGLSTFSALGNRNYRIMWVGTLLSHTGDFMQLMAQNWLVLQLTNSALYLGISSFCLFAPRILLSVFGGVIADRYDRRNVMIVTQFLAMAQAFIFAGLVWAGWIRFWHIVLLILALGVINTINQSARQSMVPGLVPKSEMMNAISLNAAMISSTRVLGPSLGGILVGIIGVAGVFFLNGLSFLAILLSLFALRLEPGRLPPVNNRVRDELKEGFRYIFSIRKIYVTLLMAYVIAIFGMSYSTLVPIFARDILNAGVRGYGILMAASGLGGVAASLVLASLGDFPHRRQLLFGAAALFGGLLISFARSRDFSLSLILLFMAGASQLGFRSTAQTVVQIATPDFLRGRVTSMLFMDFGLIALGALILGTLAHAMSAPFAVTLGGSVILLFSFFVYFKTRGGKGKDEVHPAVPVIDTGLEI